MLKKEGFILSVVILIGAFLRFWQLGQVPVGATLDEMGYIYNAYSIAQTGKNVFGQNFPLFTWMVPGGFPFMPVPIYLSAIVIKLLGFSLTTGRLLSAVLGIIDIFILFLIVRSLFGKISLALLSALFLAISPWHLHFSRSAYDPNYSLFFYLLGISTFLWEVKRNKTPILSLLSFLIAVYSYRGMSIIALPLFAVIVWYAIVALRILKKQLIGFIIGVFIIIFSLISVISVYKSSYTAEGTAIFNNPKMTEEINKASREAQGPLIVKRIFINKPTYIVNSIRENFVKSMSFEYLFLYTEPYAIYSIWSRGRLYFLDILFIGFGVFFLFLLKKKEAVFVLLLLLIGAIPGAIGGFPVSARNLFQAAIFPVFTAAGVIFIVQDKLFKKLKYVIPISILILYSYALTSYLFDYYGRYAFGQAEAWGKSFKDVSAYILDNKDKRESIFIGPTTHGDFIQFAFYAKITAEEVQTIWERSNHKHEGPFKYKNITFLPTCSIIEKARLKNSSVYITHAGCNDDATPSAAIKDYWGNDIWRIYQ